MKTAFVTHPIYLSHRTGTGHPESPARLNAILNDIKKTGLSLELEMVEPSLHPEVFRSILHVHHESYYHVLKEKAPENGTLLHLDADTPYSSQSLSAAEMAVSAVLTAIDRVMEGAVSNGFCAVRPPGHHAEADRGMGFCLFNNVAIGARYLQQQYRLPKIFILDWDVHHGNGTQHSFYTDPTVFYFSVHQYPLYPGTGAEKERGSGVGEGFTCNVPLESGAGDDEMRMVFEKRLAPAIEWFRPDFILISAGFDAHRDDPLAGLNVTEQGFYEMTRVVKSLAGQYCQGRIVSCLEGGYHLSALAKSVSRHLEALGL